MGPSPLYSAVIFPRRPPSSQRTDGLKPLRFECCFVLKSITKDEESSATNRISSAQIAQKFIFRFSPKRTKNPSLSRKSPVKKMGSGGMAMPTQNIGHRVRTCSNTCPGSALRSSGKSGGGQGGRPTPAAGSLEATPAAGSLQATLASGRLSGAHPGGLPFPSRIRLATS